MQSKILVNIATYFLCIVSFGFIAGASMELLRIHNIRHNGITTKATVTKVYESTNTEQNGIVLNLTYMVNGEKYFAENRVLLMDSSLHKTGNFIEIIYNKYKPEDSIINTAYEAKSYTYFTLLGCILLIGTFYFRRFLLKFLVQYY